MYNQLNTGDKKGILFYFEKIKYDLIAFGSSNPSPTHLLNLFQSEPILRIVKSVTSVAQLYTNLMTDLGLFFFDLYRYVN